MIKFIRLEPAGNGLFSVHAADRETATHVTMDAFRRLQDHHYKAIKSKQNYREALARATGEEPGKLRKKEQIKVLNGTYYQMEILDLLSQAGDEALGEALVYAREESLATGREVRVGRLQKVGPAWQGEIWIEVTPKYDQSGTAGTRPEGGEPGPGEPNGS